MAKITVYNQEGKKVEDVEVTDAVFGVPLNADLLHQVYTVIAGNIRENWAHTKDRSERAGSGRKPWRQKGTGRARAGTVRSPLWRKGGITFGPSREQNFSRKINAQMKKKATKMIISEKIRNNDFIVVDSLAVKDEKTKNFSKMLKQLKIDKNALIGVGVDEKDMRRACRNIENVSIAMTDDVNVYTLMNVRHVIMSKASLMQLEKRLSE